MLAVAVGCELSLSACAGSPTDADVPVEAPTIERAYTERIANGASVAHLVLQADAPLAADIDPDSISLDGVLFGYGVTEASRLDDVTLAITVRRLEGAEPEEGSYGYVGLPAAAFAEPHDLLYASEDAGEADEGADASASLAQLIALPVGEPDATVIPLEGSYDEEAGEFLLPVSLGYAEFVRTPTADDFALADPSLGIKGVDYDDASLTRATLRIDASAGESPRDAFDALDATLTADGITVAAGATNCGELTIGSNDMREAERDGFETTALSCVSSQASAFVEDTFPIESKTQDDDGDTDYDVHLLTRIDATPGSCLLPDAGIGEVVSVDHLTDDDAQVLGEDVIRVDDTHLFLNVYLPSKVVDALSDAEGEDALEEAQRIVATFARSHQIILGPGVLCNAWGVPEPQTALRLHLVSDLADDDAPDAGDDASFQLIRDAYALESDAEIAPEQSDDNGGAGTVDDNEGLAQRTTDDNPSADAVADDASDPDASDDADSAADEVSSDDIDPEALRDSYDGSEASDVEEDDSAPDDEIAALAGTYGSVDYAAYDLANDDEDLKRAKEAFEVMDKIFETAGAFAEFAAGNPSGLLEGAGGVFGFVSQALGFGEGELLSLQDVMDKLNKMDSEITAIDSKIDQLATQLSEVEARLLYHDDLNLLRSCLTKTEVYGSVLEADVWNESAVTWEYDETKGFDGMSDEQIAALETFLDDIDGVQSTYGYNAAADTVMLGKLIIGDPSLVAQSVVQEYDDCIDTLFNWEPETYIYRMLFMVRLKYAYICGYTTAVTQLQYTAWKSDRPEKYTQALKVLTDNYKQVQEVMQGKTTYEKGKATQVEESELAAATHARADGKLKNLVTGQLFDIGSEESIYNGGLVGFCNHCSSPSGVTTYAFDGTITRGNFESMVKRLSNTKYESLWDEIVAMTGSDIGFVDPNGWSAGIKKHDRWYHRGFFSSEPINAYKNMVDGYETKDYYRYVLVSDAERHTLHNRPSIQHTCNWTADCFDLVDNHVCTGEEIYIADQTYNAKGGHWEMVITLHHYCTLKAAQE